MPVSFFVVCIKRPGLRFACFLFLLLCVLCCSSAVQAADESAAGAMYMQHGVIRTATEIFLTEARSVSGGIESAATRLFWTLCSIAIVLNGIKLIFNDGDLQSFAAVLVRFLIIIGVFEFLLKNGSAIGSSVINSLTALTAKQGGGPAELADAVIEVSYALLQSVDESNGWFSTNKLVMGLFLIVFDFIMFGVVAACLVLYLSAYVLCVLGVFVLGFGALSFTRPIAVNYLKAVLSIGLELMTMLLICNAGIRGLNLVREIAENGGAITFSIYAMLLLVALLMWTCAGVLPPLVGSLVSGFDSTARSRGGLEGFAAQLRRSFSPFKLAGGGAMAIIKGAGSSARRRR